MSHHRLQAGASTPAVRAAPGGISSGNRRPVPTDSTVLADSAPAQPAAPGSAPARGRVAPGTAERASRAGTTEHPARAASGQGGRPVADAGTARPRTAGAERPPPGPGRVPAVRSWPLLVLALPAAVAIWSGWVGIGQMTGFGQVHPLPGIWDSLHLDTAVTLPVGVEAYAAFALRAWLSASAGVSARTRQFARRSAIGSLLLGMAGQVTYHLLAQAGTSRAPWAITTAVACLPVLVLGTGAALAHLLRADTLQAAQETTRHPGQDHPDRTSSSSEQPSGAIRPQLLAQAKAAGSTLTTAGQRVSRRSLRQAGVRGSNAELGAVARLLTSQIASQQE